jgi:C4-dicarboxylate-specific signal transduction histidine kinase
MGQLTASIAHEIKQPLATARNNAAAALRFLDNSPPDVAEVREALTCIVDDTDRTNDVVDRIASLIKKAPPRKEVVDLNRQGYAVCLGSPAVHFLRSPQ